MQINEAPVHPSLAVSDLAKSREWYAEKLGWEPSIEPPDVGVLVYELGKGAAFTLYETPHAGTAKNTVMNWSVADARETVAALREKGVTIEDYDFGDFGTKDGIMEAPDGSLTAWFKDPDGNTISIVSGMGDPGTSIPEIVAMLAASDLERAKRWYAEQLGFQPVYELPNVLAGYRSGDSTFSVYQTEFAGTAKNTVAVWRIKGLLDEVARLRQLGVAFEDYDFGDDGATVAGILSDEFGPLNAWFTDSEGNILALVEDRN